jgi:hypothetical protein
VFGDDVALKLVMKASQNSQTTEFLKQLGVHKPVGRRTLYKSK